MSDDSHCDAGGHGELDSSIYIEFGSRIDVERFRALMVELGAPPEYVAAIDPATAFQRMTRERNAAIVAAIELLSRLGVGQSAGPGAKLDTLLGGRLATRPRSRGWRQARRPP